MWGTQHMQAKQKIQCVKVFTLPRVVVSSWTAAQVTGVLTPLRDEQRSGVRPVRADVTGETWGQ